MTVTREKGHRPAMERVDIHELKTRLSQHLQRVALGARLPVTDRGPSIATIAPIDAPDGRDWAHQLVSEGRACWGGGEPQGARYPARITGRTAAAMLLADRR
jgi:antitoxin (DNA-binding transcriptional repressor) of toxin-antitoxin stability system